MPLNTEELYRNLFETSKDSIFIAELETGNIVDVNTSACKLYGYTKTAFLKQNISNISAEPEKTILAFKNLETSIPLRYHCKKDGTRFPVDITVNYFEQKGTRYLSAVIREVADSFIPKQGEQLSDNWFRAIIDVSPLAMIYLDVQGNVRMWNRSAEQIFGWTADEVIGKPNPIIPNEGEREYEALSQEVFTSGPVKGREVVRQRKDGSLININISSSTIHNQKGEIIGRMAILEDVTERKQLEEKLIENEVIFSSFMEHSPIYVFFKDKNIRTLRLSKNYEQMLGMPMSEVLGKTMDELFPSDLAKSMVADDLRILNEAKRVEVVEELNGKIFNTIKFPIIKDGEPIMLAGFTIDITEQKLMTQQLEMLKQSIDRHFDSAYWMDTSNRFVYVNNAGCDALQYTSEELLKMIIGDVNPVASQEAMQRVWHRLRTEGSYISETLHRRKDGTEFPVEIASTYIKFGDKEYNCGFARDITERKKAEQKLIESEAVLSSLIHNRKESIWSIDMDLKYVIINDMFRRFYLGAFGVEIKPGMKVADTLPPDLSAFWKSKYMEALSGEIVEFEYSRVILDRPYTFAINITPIIINMDIIGASVISIDITNRKRGEEALQQSEEKFRRIADQMVDVLFTTDVNGVITYLSPSSEQVFGWKPSEMIGCMFSDFLEEKSKSSALEKFRTHAEKAEPTRNFMVSMDTKNGNVFPGEVNSSIIQNNQGEIIGTLGLIRNISEKVAFEEALTNERNNLRTLIDNLPDAIFFKDIEGNYLINNKPHLLSLGKSEQEEVAGKNVFDFHQKEFAEQYSHDENEIIRTGQSIINKEEKTFSFNRGEERWHLTSKIPVKDRNGKVISIVGISRDITDRKLMENALLTSEEKYRLLFENMTVGFALHEMIFDNAGNALDYRFVEINSVFEKLTGLKASQIIGKTVKEAIPNIEQYWIDFYGEVVKSGNPTSYQNFASDLGKYYDVWVFKAGYHRFATIFNDITEQKFIQEALRRQNEGYELLNKEYISLNEELLESNQKLEKINADLEKAKLKAEESDRLKTAFLCNMSHEIRTPMNAILGFSDFIIKPTIAEEKKEKFSRLIKERANDLLRIIEDILDISKIEIGQMNIVESEVAIRELLNDLMEYYKQRKENQKSESNVKISLKLDGKLADLVILVDGQRLKQVLTNLVDNSLKFTSEGSINIGCEFSESKQLLFSVVDTGIGIPEDKQHVVFDRFRQAEDLYSTRHYGGTGLGLSISKGLVNLMGGDIWFESKVGEGTKFFFTLPCKSVGKNDNKNVEFGNQLNMTNKKLTILVVEDDKSSAELLNEIIEGLNINIINVYNGKDALESFQNTADLDLVLLDIRLPDANGLDLARQMKVLRPKIPIIAQTAYASDADCRDCLQAGCDSYISKPIVAETLLKRITEVVGNGAK